MIKSFLNWVKELFFDRGEEVMLRDYITIHRAYPPPKELTPLERREASITKPFFLYVDDNFHYMDESHRYITGEFDTRKEAVAYAKKIVDETIIPAIEDGLSPVEAYENYKTFGEDPWIGGSGEAGPEDEPFSAWTYAEQRCYELYEQKKMKDTRGENNE